jgi:hypothetical protein
MARAVFRLNGDMTIFEELELEAEISFNSDNENCSSERATSVADAPVGLGPPLPLSDTSCVAGPYVAAT